MLAGLPLLYSQDYSPQPELMALLSYDAINMCWANTNNYCSLTIFPPRVQEVYILLPSQ